MNNTANTNKNNTELFAGVAGMLGEGLPRCYLLITSKANAAPHAKHAALIDWVRAFRALGADPQFTLSDKDQSEINALKYLWPQAKHQLCLWHLLRSLKRRLSQYRHPISRCLGRYCVPQGRCMK
jgi:hypothetical protein